MLPPPPPAFPPQNIANIAAPNSSHQMPTTRWNGNGLPADPRLSTPRISNYQNLAAGAPQRQIDSETMQLLQLKQQLLQQQGTYKCYNLV